MRRKFWGLLIILLGFLSSGAKANKFEYLTNLNGLIDNSVKTIFQDSKGYIWIGTRTGICRYDGFDIIPVKTNGNLNSEIFFAIAEDDNNRIWACSMLGIYLYEPNTNILVKQHDLNRIWCAEFVWYNGMLVCGTSEGLLVLDNSTNEWIYPSWCSVDFRNMTVTSLTIDHNDRLIIGKPNGYMQMDSRFINYKFIRNPEDHRNAILEILVDHNNNLWVGTPTGLYCRNNDGNIIHSFENELLSMSRCMENDKQGNIWVGGEFGIHVFDTTFKLIKRFERKLIPGSGLNDNAVYSILCDRAGDIWIGTYFGGINYYITQNQFNIYTYGTGSTHLSGKVARQMTEDGKGNLWIALEDGGLNRLDMNTGQISHYLSEYIMDTWKYANVHTLLLNDNKLWIGKFASGLSCYEVVEKNDQINLKFLKEILPDRDIFALAKDKNNRLWIGTSIGLYTADPPDYCPRLFKNEIFGQKYIYALWVGKNHEILIGTSYNGLYVYYPERDEVISFAEKNNKPPNGKVSSISEDRNGNALVVNENGIYRYNSEQKSLELKLDRERIGNAYSIVEDQEGKWWIGTSKGLILYNVETDYLKLFTHKDGLPDNQFNFNSSYITSDGEIFFGTINGLFAFYPERISFHNIQKPVVYFNSYRTNDKESKDTIVWLNTDNSNIVIKPFQSYITINFSSVHYPYSENIQYAVQINDADTWDRLGTQRTITLTNLPIGELKLQVRSSMDGIDWGEPSNLRLKVMPPFWLSKTAITGYSIIFLIVVVTLYNFVSKRIKEKNMLAYERLEKERERELSEQKLRFFLHLSHEFRNPLTLIIGPLQRLIKELGNSYTVRNKLTSICKNAEVLNNLVEEFIDYHKADAGFKPLSINQQFVLKFVSGIAALFDNWISPNRITYKKIIRIDDQPGYFDHSKLERIITNLLSNAFKYSNNKGSVTFEAFVEKKKNLTIKISNTGPAIPPSKFQQIFEYFNHEPNPRKKGSGIGLAYTAGLVKLHRGIISVESGQKHGTTFIVTIPIDKESYKDLEINNGKTIKKVIEDNESLSVPEISSSGHIEFLKKNPLKILAVDDHREFLEYLDDVLSPLCQKFIYTHDPYEVIDLVKNHQIDLVISDIKMPRVNGFQVLDTLHNNIETSHVPVLILSAIIDKEIKQKMYRKGAMAFVNKPFTEDELLIQIKNLMKFRIDSQLKFKEKSPHEYKDIIISKKDEDFLIRATEIVNNHMMEENFSVTQFCREIGMSRTLLHNKLKTITGLSATAFINSVKLKKARELINNDINVSEIAYACGFNDPTYFTRCFKKFYGFNPSEIKKHAG
ncbi:MAG: response regulator [Deltaproteobacteria bacterium]|nr:response regulator [Deltaproteobacteria bacterium]